MIHNYPQLTLLPVLPHSMPSHHLTRPHTHPSPLTLWLKETDPCPSRDPSMSALMSFMMCCVDSSRMLQGTRGTAITRTTATRSRSQERMTRMPYRTALICTAWWGCLCNALRATAPSLCEHVCCSFPYWPITHLFISKKSTLQSKGNSVRSTMSRKTKKLWWMKFWRERGR